MPRGMRTQRCRERFDREIRLCQQSNICMLKLLLHISNEEVVQASRMPAARLCPGGFQVSLFNSCELRPAGCDVRRFTAAIRLIVN